MSDSNSDAMAPETPSKPENLNENGAPQRRGMIRRLYDWVLSWADTPYGTPALAVLAFAEASFFPIPPDVLQMALSVSKPKRSFYYATVATIFSVLGAFLGYYIGFALWESMGETLMACVPGLDQELIDKVRVRYNENAFLAIAGAAFTPIPYKIFTIAAGLSNVSLWILLIASIIGRGARFYLMAGLVRMFGPGVKELIERYFGIATLLMFVLLVGGFLVVKVLLH